MRLLLAALAILWSSTAYPLISTYENKFATAQTIAAPGDAVTQWFDIRQFFYVDFTVVATAGDGTLTVQYASNSSGDGLIDDPTLAAFDTTQAATLQGAGVGKFFVRLKVTCTTAPCTYSGWFTAKGTTR